MEKPPIVCVAGKSGAGKTTFLEKLIRELKNRKVRVGTIKHDAHGFDMNIPGKDTWRHAQAGANAVIISSPARFALIKNVEEEMSLDRVAELIPDMDIILVEGYKRSSRPKIEISRTAQSNELICMSDDLIALVSDAKWDIGIPLFDLDDSSGVSDLLMKKHDLPDRRKT